MSYMCQPDEQGAFTPNTDNQDIEMSNTSTEMPLSNVIGPSNHGQRPDAHGRQKSAPQQASNAMSAAKAAVDSGARTSTAKALNQGAGRKDTTHDAESVVPRARKLKEEPQDDLIQKLGDELQAQKMLNQELGKSNQELERSIKAVRDLLAQEKRDHGQLKVQYKGLESDYGQFRDQCGGLQTKVRQREIQINKLTIRIADLSQLLEEEKQSSKSIKLRLEDEQARTQELESRVMSQEISVTKAQEAAVKVLSTTVSSAIPDDSIRRQFDTLFLSLHDWARDNSIRHLSGLKQSPFLSTLVERKVLADHETWKPDHRFDIDDDTAPDTLLNAAVAKEVCNAFIKKPFSFTQDSEKRSGSDLARGGSFMPSTASVLGSIKSRLEQENAARAHTWRAHTVEALSSGEQGKAAVHQYAEGVVATILERYALLLNPDIEDQDKRRLLDIVMDFGSLALQLWSQKSEVVYYGLRFFSEQPFSVSSGDMRAARAVRLEESDPALDGRPIPVVVQPLIVAFGTPEGEDYQKRKIWSKAVVWVSSKNKPPPTATPQKGWSKYVRWPARDNGGSRHH